MQRLLNNWKLKLMSLVLALVLWSHVRGEVNPWETATFRVPLRWTPPPQVVVMNANKIPATVRVNLRAPRSRLRELKGFAPANPLGATTETTISNGDVSATLDFSLAKSGAQDVPVKVEARSDDVEIIGSKPGDIVMRLDRAMQRAAKIEVLPVTAHGYSVEKIQLDRQQTQLSGPSNRLERVAQVQARVRSGTLQLNATKQITAPLEAVDKAGKAVSGVRLTPETVQVSAVLREEVVTRRLPIRVQITGAPDENSAAVKVLPSRLMVRGPLLEIEKIEALSLTIAAADLNPTGETVLRRRVVLPAGIAAVDAPRVRVQVLAPSPTPQATPENTATPTASEIPARREVLP